MMQIFRRSRPMNHRHEGIRNACGALVVLLIAAAVAAAWSPPAHGLSFMERKEGVWGVVTDVDGNPLKDITITLAKNREGARVLEVETNSKGTFGFPRVEFYDGGYRIGIESDEYFIREFLVRTRRLNRDVWQDDTGKLTPDTQDRVPLVRYRGGNAYIEFTLARVSDFESAAKRRAAEERRARAKAKQKKRKLTPLEQAQEAIALGDYATAVKKFEQVIEKNPDDADLRWRYTNALARAGDRSAALLQARKVLELDPDRVGVRLRMASWLADRGQLSTAVPLLEKEKELDPANPDVLQTLIAAYRDAGQPEKAEQIVADWAEAAPNDPQALMALAEIKASEGDFSGAEELYGKIAEMSPEGAHKMFYNTGVSILNQKGVDAADRERAVTAFEKALEISPDYANAHLRMGDALVGLGRMDEALTHYRKFLELAPDHGEAGKVRGIVQALEAR
jgi:tetratricopeptide (TPR) repeat protein